MSSAEPEPVWTSWAKPSEVDTFDEFVKRFRDKEITAEEFKLFRLQNGVYGQNQAEGVMMVRVKIPAGGLTAGQLEALAEFAGRTQRGAGHVTTRQNFQFHFVKLEEATQRLGLLNAAGLTTREACAATVRTMTACHRAGVCPTEAFDVSPYAAAATSYFLRNPLNQNLPRKVKVSFSGCPRDCALPILHDIGVVAKVRTSAQSKTERGFELYLGGGLGASPKAAKLLEPFTPEAELLVTMSAVLAVFERVGNREQKALARMKYALERLGWEAFQGLVLKERARLKLALAGIMPEPPLWTEGPAASPPSPGAAAPESAPYARWRSTNVVDQKQAGYALVHARLELGDVTAAQLKTLAEAVRRFSNGTLRTTVQQNVAIRWVPLGALPELYALLEPAGLAKPGAERLLDVTSCPGADTCQIGITSSRGLARTLTARLEADLARLADLSGLRVKISGCPNSCGQHHVAAIGLFGGAKKFGDHTVPTYQMMLGGGDTRFAKPFLKIPAANVPDAVAELVELFGKQRRPQEPFYEFIERYGFEKLKTELSPRAELPPFETSPQLYRDVATALEEVAGSRETFQVNTGKGECSA